MMFKIISTTNLGSISWTAATAVEAMEKYKELQTAGLELLLVQGDAGRQIDVEELERFARPVQE